jgi:hypothetical protein
LGVKRTLVGDAATSIAGGNNPLTGSFEVRTPSARPRNFGPRGATCAKIIQVILASSRSCQAHLRRCLVLVDSAHKLFFTENGLVSLIAIRSLYETVANFLDYERKLQALLDEGDLQKIHDFVHARTYATRLKRMIDFTGSPDVQATNILTQIDRMNEIRDTVREEYDLLCEHAHPNGFGGVLYFADLQSERDTAIFQDAGSDPTDDLKWIIVGTNLLRYFEQALDRIEARLPALSAKGRELSPHLEKKSD